MEYPKYESVTVTIFPRHVAWLNRRLMEAGVNRSLSVREALELLIAKTDEPDNDEAPEVITSQEASNVVLERVADYEAPEVIASQDDEALKQMGAGGEACP